MPLFTFDLSQQHFELRWEQRNRRLSQDELLTLIDRCEQVYYSGRSLNASGQAIEVPEDLIALGQELYRWLDGEEGWLRTALTTGEPQTIAFRLDYQAEIQGLNLSMV